jgi:beta-phosphoglucomutase-like phosphatase (HAD superfamily)
MTKAQQALKTAQERLEAIKATRELKLETAKEYEEMAAQEYKEAEAMRLDEQEAIEAIETLEEIKAAMGEALGTLLAKGGTTITESDIAEALSHVWGEDEEPPEIVDAEDVAA